jgi:triosephosphate isomerase
MNLTVEQSTALVRSMQSELEAIDGVERVICPVFTALAPVSDLLHGSPLKLGAQNAFWEEKGAFTGEVSPAMLAPICQYVILGHSERRQFFGETDAIVNRKVRAVLAHDLSAIFCVGENLAENEAGRTEEVVTRQVRGGLVDVPALDRIVVAYEPVWAIGTGRAATVEGAAEVIGLIRATLADLYGEEAAAGVRIQYGGSVNAKNVRELMADEEIDGALVGGASLNAADFVSIVRQTAEAKASAG